MSSEVKINGINMFINKLDSTEEIIDIDALKSSFELDEGETGFYKLSLSQKKIFGSETLNDTYNRPPVGPIQEGLYCSYCGKIGPEDHSEICDFPEDNSLYLSMSGFSDYVLSKADYQGDYKKLKDDITTKMLTQEQLNEILLIPDEIIVEDGTFNLSENSNVLTNISYFGIYKKRGPKKLASKTTTTQFLNNVIISYEKNLNKTSIRISKNGLINLINIPNDRSEIKEMIDTLITRINNSGSVNNENFNNLTGLDRYAYIADKSYIHSMSGQFTLNVLEKPGNQINFENLDNIISPFDSLGNLVASDFTRIERTTGGDNIINFNGIRIIEWEYSLGRLTRNQVMSKEFIKFVCIPADGVKLTAVVNKFGVIMMTLSLCSDKQIRKGLCGDSFTPLNESMFNNVIINFNKLFDSESDILLRKSLSTAEKTTSVFNTISGYAPSGKICRLTRTRDSGDKTYKEGMRPEPYSWKGTCPDPNYQYLKPEGVQDTDGLWYPCCETKTKESVEMMKRYLLTGFPKNKSQAEIYNITDREDLGSGILIPGSNVIGASAKVNIGDRMQDVTIIKKLSKKSNEYVVKTNEGNKVTVKGTDFERDSRAFPGLNSFRREQLLNCIQKNLFKFDLTLNPDGKLIKNDVSIMNERYSKYNADKFISLFSLSDVITENMTYYNIKKFTDNVYNVRKVPGGALNFFLVLSPDGNYYIDEKLNSVECQISNRFTDTIILNGYLRFNEIEFKNEYHITDLLYYNELLTNNKFQQRYAILFDLQNLVFTSIIDEILIYPDVYSNIIEGSYEITEADKYIKLVFVDTTCCNYIIWGNKDKYPDIIQLQILEKSRQTIKFGYDNKGIPEGIGLDFLNSYTFNKREIPDDLFVNEYFNIRINRDASGKVVPNRKISIVDKTQMLNTFDETINILLTKFNPLEYIFFNSPDEWDTENDTYTFLDGLLSIA
tara:strand:+ start:9463 stop:12309 length:2847 start_codon:yes stop_codon:yes gene_type:complete